MPHLREPPTVRQAPPETLGDVVGRILRLEEPPDEIGPYAIAYHIKHGIVDSTRKWLANEPQLYLDADHNVRTSSLHRDYSHEMAPVLGEAALMLAPVANALAGGKLFAARGGAPLCFAPGTKVLMADGSTKAIEEVHPGDLVLTDDPEDDEGPRSQEVIAVHKAATHRIFHIQVTGEYGGEILSTGRHPFWTKRGWMAAEELTTSDLLLDEGGREVAIAGLAVESRDTPTFNLSVDGDHTFFVVAGKTSVLVHNVDPWDIKFSQSSYGAVFAEGPWAGRSLAEAIAEARALGRLPEGLTLNAMRMGDGSWVTLNNRTLAVARGANLLNVNPVEAGGSGLNKLNQLLRSSDLVGPVEDAVMRCK
jgi:hypothetical protein